MTDNSTRAARLLEIQHRAEKYLAWEKGLVGLRPPNEGTALVRELLKVLAELTAAEASLKAKDEHIARLHTSGIAIGAELARAGFTGTGMVEGVQWLGARLAEMEINCKRAAVWRDESACRGRRWHRGWQVAVKQRDEAERQLTAAREALRQLVTKWRADRTPHSVWQRLADADELDAALGPSAVQTPEEK